MAKQDQNEPGRKRKAAEEPLPWYEVPDHRRRIQLRPWIFHLMEGLVKSQVSDMAEEVNRACRELLQREGKWKGPPEDEPAGGES